MDAVKDIHVGGNRKLDNEILLAHNALKPGEHYNAQAMQAGLRRMQDEYGSRGFINTRVLPEFNFSTDPGAVTVVYKVDEGPESIPDEGPPLRRPAISRYAATRSTSLGNS